MTKLVLKRGDIWLINLDPSIGHEQNKKRPCIIISVDAFNEGASGLIVVLPITSKFKAISWLVPIETTYSKLKSISYIICNQPRTISIERLFGNCLGTVNESTMEKIGKRLSTLLGI